MTHGIKKINTKIDMCENPPQKNYNLCIRVWGRGASPTLSPTGTDSQPASPATRNTRPSQQKKTAKRAQHLKTVTRFRYNNSWHPGVCAFTKFDWLTTSVNQNNTIGQKITNRHLVQLDSFSQKVIFILKTFKKCGWVVGGWWWW